MTNNDILRRLRYAFDIDDSKMIALFSSADLEVSREQISDWLKKEEDPAYKACSDTLLATFLNGFINDKRGKKDGPQPVPETKLTNNIIFRKLRIALSLESDDMLDILGLVEYRLSKHELSSFFRRIDHRQYRECKDQILRNFLHGLQLKYRPDATPAKASAEVKKDIKVVPDTIAPAQVTPAKTEAPKVTPAKPATATVKKDAKPEFKWQKDRNPAEPKTGNKETTAVLSKDGKTAFKWNADPKASQSSKPKPDQEEALASPKKKEHKKPKKKGNDTKPAFKWSED